MTVDIHPSSRPPQKRRVTLPAYFRPLKKDARWGVIVTGMILFFAVVGLPQLGQKKLELQNPVIVDLVDIKDVKRGPVSAAPNTTRKRAPEKAAVRKTEQKEPPKAAKTDIKPPEPKKIEPEKPKDKPKADEKPVAPKDTINLKPQDKKKPADKAKDKKVEKPEDKAADFNAMLKNLVGDDAPTPPAEDEPSAHAPVDENARTAVAATYGKELTLSDMDALRHQLAQCWNIPSGAVDAENLIVDIRVVVRPDRTVESATIVDQNRYRTEPFFRAAADSARRAVLNPRCSPLDLPDDQYDTWKNMIIRFNPREMFGGF